MGAGRAEADRPKDSGHEGYVIILELSFCDLTFFAQFLHHVQTQDIGLAFLQRGGMLLHRMANGALTVQRVFNAQTMGHFVKHRVAEE